jgi:hypothetical protein
VLRGVCFRGSFEFDLFFTFFAFDLLVVVHVVLDSKFKLCVFMLLMYSSRGILRNQVVIGLIYDE